MQVRLTERQAVWVRRAFLNHPGEAVVQHFYDQAEHLGHSVDITLPPDAWHHAVYWLFSHVYTLGGGKHPTAGSAGMKAHQRVQRAVNERRTHPAFRGAAVLGTDTTVLTGWRGRTVAPFRYQEPHPTATFVLLLPEPAIYKGSRITVWRPHVPADVACSEELADERLHVPFGHDAPDVRGGPQGGSSGHSG